MVAVWAFNKSVGLRTQLALEITNLVLQATRQKLIKSCSPGKRARRLPTDVTVTDLVSSPKAGGMRRARTQPSLNRYNTRMSSIRKSGEAPCQPPN